MGFAWLYIIVAALVAHVSSDDLNSQMVPITDIKLAWEIPLAFMFNFTYFKIQDQVYSIPEFVGFGNKNQDENDQIINQNSHYMLVPSGWALAPLSAESLEFVNSYNGPLILADGKIRCPKSNAMKSEMISRNRFHEVASADPAIPLLLTLCKSGWWSELGSEECSPCPPGSSSKAGAAKCVPLSQETVSDVSNSQLQPSSPRLHSPNQPRRNLRNNSNFKPKHGEKASRFQRLYESSGKPPAILTVVAISGVNLVDILVHISHDGVVHCRAFTKSSSDISSEGHSSVSLSNSSKIRISSLRASTDYTVVCSSASIEDAVLPLQNAFSAAVDVKTLSSPATSAVESSSIHPSRSFKALDDTSTVIDLLDHSSENGVHSTLFSLDYESLCPGERTSVPSSPSSTSSPSLAYDLTFQLSNRGLDISDKTAATANVTVACQVGKSTTRQIKCKSSIFEVNCSGDSDYTIEATCPYSMKVPTCDLSVTVDEISRAVKCEVISYTSSVTSCGCNVCHIDLHRSVEWSTTRKLRTGKKSSTVELIYTSIIVSADQFVKVMGSASKFGDRKTYKSTARIFFLFLIIWSSLPILWQVSVSFRWRISQQTREHRQNKRRSAVNVRHGTHTDESVSVMLENYIHSLIPRVYFETDVRRKCYLALIKHVPLFIVLTSGHRSTINKILIMFRALTATSFGMFALAFFYSLQFPQDNGSCDRLTSESECILVKSLLDFTKSQCHWEFTTTDRSSITGPGLCTWETSSFSLYVTVLMCVLTVIASTPATYILDRLFDDILLAPTPHDLTHNELVGRMSQIHIPVAKKKNKLAKFKNVFRTLEKTILLPTDVVQARSVCKRSVQALSEGNVRAGNTRNRGTVLTAVSREELHLKLNERVNVAMSISNDLSARRAMLMTESSQSSFDTAWGIESVNADGFCELEAASKEALTMESDAADALATKTLSDIQYMNDNMCGAVLIRLLLVDIVGPGSLEGRVLRNLIDATLVPTKRVITWPMKYLVFSGIVVANLYFLFACVLYGAFNGNDWQVAWRRSCLINVFTDLLMNPCLEAVILNVVVPGSIAKSVAILKESVSMIVDQVRQKELGIVEEVGDGNLDDLMSKYFFSSKKVAAKRPDLMEGAIVNWYHINFPYITPYLRNKIQQQQYLLSMQGRRFKRNWSCASFSFSDAISFLLKSLAAQPRPVQKFVVQLTQPVLIGTVGFTYSEVKHDTLYLMLFIVGMCVALVSLTCFCCRNPRAVAPMPIDLEASNEGVKILEKSTVRHHCEDDEFEKDGEHKGGQEELVRGPSLVSAFSETFTEVMKATPSVTPALASARSPAPVAVQTQVVEIAPRASQPPLVVPISSILQIPVVNRAPTPTSTPNPTPSQTPRVTKDQTPSDVKDQTSRKELILDTTVKPSHSSSTITAEPGLVSPKSIRILEVDTCGSRPDPYGLFTGIAITPTKKVSPKPFQHSSSKLSLEDIV